MKNRKLTDVLKLEGESINVEFKIQEQESSMRKYFPKASKAILQILKRQNLDI